MSSNTVYVYVYVEVGVIGVLFLPMLVIWLVSLFVVRQRSDPARWAFAWMKAVFPLMSLAILLFIAGDAVEINGFTSGVGLSDDTILVLGEIATRVGLTGVLLERLGNIALIMCLTELGLGFLCVWKRIASQVIIRSLAAFVAVVLLAIAVATYARLQVFYADYFSYLRLEGDRPNYEILSTSRRLSAAFDIILFIGTLVIFIFTIAILAISRGQRQLRSGAVMFLFIGLLYLLCGAWLVVYNAEWVLPGRLEPSYTTIIIDILQIWLVFVILVLVFTLGCRNTRGFWSRGQYGTSTLPNSSTWSQGQTRQPIELPQQEAQWPIAMPQQEARPIELPQQQIYAYHSMHNQTQYPTQVVTQHYPVQRSELPATIGYRQPGVEIGRPY